jgi:D-amino-acid dehydrogenase
MVAIEQIARSYRFCEGSGMKKRIGTLIIGGGSIGVCAAYFLASKGKEVIVVDQGEVGAACSYGNAGMICPSHIAPLAVPGALMQGLKWMFNAESPFYIKPRLDLALMSWIWQFGAACDKKRMLKSMSLLRRLSDASLALYEELASVGGMKFHFAHQGSLMLYKDQRSFDESAEKLQLLNSYGVVSQVLGHAEVRKVEPKVQSCVVGGIYFPEDAHLNPFEFVRALAERAQNEGAGFLTSTEVLGFETSNGSISDVRTTRGDFAIEQIVLAAGSWSSRLVEQLGLALPIQPAKGYSITFRCSDRGESIPLWLSEARVIVTPMGEVLRFAGTLELAGFDLSINQRRVRAVQRAVQEYLIGMDKYELLEIWRGLRPLTPDGLPIIGRSQKWKNLIIATGHGMQGIALGPVTGKIVAQLTCRETPCVDVADLGVARFV